MRRRSRSMCTSSALRVGVPPGHARRTSVSRPTTALNRSISAAASARSTGDNVTHRPLNRNRPSSSTVGTASDLPARPASVDTRTRRSSSAAGRRIQSSNTSTGSGGARSSPTNNNRGAPVARSRSNRSRSSGQRTSTTSVTGGSLATSSPFADPTEALFQLYYAPVNARLLCRTFGASGQPLRS